MSADPLIFNPVIALVAWTFLVLFAMGVLRTTGMARGRLSTEYYRYFRPEDGPEPDFLRGFTRNFINLLEVPVLFYVGCIIAYVTHLVDSTLVNLGWFFAASRVVHSAIHLTYNDTWHRAGAFVVSTLSVMAFWAILSWRLLGWG